MTYRRRRWQGAASVVGLLLALTLPASAARGLTLRVSINSAGAQANRYTQNAAISLDGQFIVFESIADNLADPNEDRVYDEDTNDAYDIFLHDRDADGDQVLDERHPGAFKTVWVSKPLGGQAPQSRKGNFGPSISADGHYVAFASDASNLVDGDVNGKRDVFLWDRLTGVTTRVSVSALGEVENGDSDEPAISGDGEHVAFTSKASNLVGLGDDINGKPDVFVRSYVTDPPTLAGVSVDSSNMFVEYPAGGSGSGQPSVSFDGRRIVFTSDAIDSTLDPKDRNKGTADIFLRIRDRDGAAGPKGFDDTGNTETRRASVTPDQGDPNGASSEPAISSDGRYIAFSTLANNILSETALQLDQNGASDVYRVDLANLDRLTTILISTTSRREAPNGASGGPALTTNGNTVVFWSKATDLAQDCNDRDPTKTVYLRDLVGQVTTCESIAPDGSVADQESDAPSINGAGTFLIYESDATNIVTEDPNVPPARDIFLHYRDRCPAGQLEDGVLSQPIHSLEDDAGPAGPVLHDLNCTYVRPNEPRE